MKIQSSDCVKQSWVNTTLSSRYFYYFMLTLDKMFIASFEPWLHWIGRQSVLCFNKHLCSQVKFFSCASLSKHTTSRTRSHAATAVTIFELWWETASRNNTAVLRLVLLSLFDQFQLITACFSLERSQCLPATGTDVFFYDSHSKHQYSVWVVYKIQTNNDFQLMWKSVNLLSGHNLVDLMSTRSPHICNASCYSVSKVS